MKARDESVLRLLPADLKYLKQIRMREMQHEAAQPATLHRSAYCANCDRRLDGNAVVYCSKNCRAAGHGRIDDLARLGK